MCLLVVFLISNAANAEQWEYVQFKTVCSVGNSLHYPDGKTDAWKIDDTKMPKNFGLFVAANLTKPALLLLRPVALHTGTTVPLMIVHKRDFSKPINVINALGLLGFEMCGVRAYNVSTSGGAVVASAHYWFKRKHVADNLINDN